MNKLAFISGVVKYAQDEIGRSAIDVPVNTNKQFDPTQKPYTGSDGGWADSLGTHREKSWDEYQAMTPTKTLQNAYVRNQDLKRQGKPYVPEAPRQRPWWDVTNTLTNAGWWMNKPEDSWWHYVNPLNVSLAIPASNYLSEWITNNAVVNPVKNLYNRAPQMAMDYIKKDVYPQIAPAYYAQLASPFLANFLLGGNSGQQSQPQPTQEQPPEQPQRRYQAYKTPGYGQ